MNAIGKNQYKIGQKINTTPTFYRLCIRWFVSIQFVAVSVCGPFGLWPFRSVTVSVCDRSGLWPFRFRAFRFVTVSVCGRFASWPFRLWPFWFVAVLTRNLTDKPYWWQYCPTGQLIDPRCSIGWRVASIILNIFQGVFKTDFKSRM